MLYVFVTSSGRSLEQLNIDLRHARTAIYLDTRFRQRQINEIISEIDRGDVMLVPVNRSRAQWARRPIINLTTLPLGRTDAGSESCRPLAVILLSAVT
jgi:hypothetical protein